MQRRRTGRVAGRISVVAFAAVACAASWVGPAGAAKVNAAPPPSSLTEGLGPSVVSFTLDQPIIAPGPDPGFVTVTLTPSDPSRLSLSQTTLHWDFNEWWQPRTFTVSAIADGVHNSSATVTVDAIVNSNAPYFAGYATSFSVTILDMDPAPSTTTAAASSTTVAASSTTVAPPATEPGSTVTSTSTTVVAVSPAELPRTGAPIGTGLVAVGGAMGVGALLAGVPRRRR